MLHSVVEKDARLESAAALIVCVVLQLVERLDAGADLAGAMTVGGSKKGAQVSDPVKINRILLVGQKILTAARIYTIASCSKKQA